MAVLGYIAKLKRSLGLAFGAHFLHDFSIKMFLILYSINGQSLPFFLLKISNKMLLNSYLESWDVIDFKIFLGSTSKAMADKEKKRGRQK